MSRLSGLEERVLSHISGNLDFSNLSTSSNISMNHSTLTVDSDKSVFFLDSSSPATTVAAEKTDTTTPLAARSDSCDNSPDRAAAKVTAQQERPQLLRKLSEILPSFPSCPWSDSDLVDSTVLPDRVVRLWAAELAQVSPIYP